MNSHKQQLTFWRQAPTTRDVADLVRAGGAEAFKLEIGLPFV